MNNNEFPSNFQFFVPVEQNVMADMLAGCRSKHTRQAYGCDLEYFFKFVSGVDVTPEIVNQFLALKRLDAIAKVEEYKTALIQKSLTAATINRRLAAIKSLVSYAYKVGKCQYSLIDVKGEPQAAYRDTAGVSAEMMRAITKVPNRGTLKGIRDYAILRLLWDNALRRNEISQCNVKDFESDSNGSRLWILGKGRGTQKTMIDLHKGADAAIAQWLEARGTYQENDPLFISLAPASKGLRLTGAGIYYLVGEIAKEAGVTKKFSPTRVRHSSLTAALDMTGGNYQRVQKLSRHASANTLRIYDDNWEVRAGQAEVTDLLGSLIKD